VGREYPAASSSHAVTGTLTGGTRRRRTHPLRSLVLVAIATLVCQAAYVAPTAGAEPSAPPVVEPAPSAPDASPDPTADDIPILDPADEVVTARTETTRTYDLGDGRHAVEAFADPVFYQPRGSTDWLPIDLDFAATEDGAAAAVTGAPVRVSVGAQTDGLVALEHDGYRIALRPIPVAQVTDPTAAETPERTAPTADPGAAEPPVDHPPVVLAAADVRAAIAAPVTDGRPVTDHQRADLPDVLPGVGLRVFAHPYGMSSFLVLAERPATTSWTLAVTSPGLRLAAGSPSTSSTRPAP